MWGGGGDDDWEIRSILIENDDDNDDVIIYIEVGDQKFISRSSDGLAFMTFGAAADVVLDCVGTSSASSLMCDDATDVVDDIVSRCIPNRLVKNQPR